MGMSNRVLCMEDFVMDGLDGMRGWVVVCLVFYCIVGRLWCFLMVVYLVGVIGLLLVLSICIVFRLSFFSGCLILDRLFMII